MKRKNVYKASVVDSHATGWIVDLSGAAAVNPDCFWKFGTEAKANQFAALVESGIDAREAVHTVNEA